MPKAKKKELAAQDPVKSPATGLQEVRGELVVKAKKAGRISQQDITAAIPDVSENAEVLDALYTELADAGVQVDAGGVTVEGDAVTVAPSGMDDDWSPEDDEEEIVEDQGYLDDIADDSVRLYLREIGKIPLLSAEEELLLARQIKLASLIEAKRFPDSKKSAVKAVVADATEENEND